MPSCADRLLHSGADICQRCEISAHLKRTAVTLNADDCVQQALLELGYCPPAKKKPRVGRG
jgi:hypothetical protein